MILPAPVTAEAQRELDRAIGQRLRQTRTARGLSQRALGRACGVTAQQVDKYEHGVNRIAYSRLLAICAALHVDASELSPPLDAVPFSGAAAPSQRVRAARLARIALRIDGAALDHLLGLAETLARRPTDP